MKDNTISLIRMIATLSVFICHVAQAFRYNIISDWFNLGVQLFFVISAFLYCNRVINNYKKFMYKRCVVILVPCIIYVLFCFIIEILLGHSVYITDVTSRLIGFGEVRGTGEFIHFWYITYIMFLYACLPIFQSIHAERLKNDFVFYFVLGFSLALIAIITFAIKTKFGIFTLSLAHLSCFIIPYFMIKKYGKLNLKKSILLLMSLFSIIFNVAVIIFRYRIFNISKYIPEEVIEQLYLYGHSFIGIVLFYYLFFILRKLKVSRATKKILNFSDKYSFSFYIVHPAVINYGFLKIAGNKIIDVIVAFAVSVFFSVILYGISDCIQKLLLRNG